jgi:hypothetical protein
LKFFYRFNLLQIIYRFETEKILKKPQQNQQALKNEKKETDIFAKLQIKVNNITSSEIKEEAIKVTEELKSHLDESFGDNFCVDSEVIKFGENVGDNVKGKFLKNSIYNSNTQVVTKSFEVNSRRLTEFRNELLTFKLLNKSNRKEFYAEFKGFILSEYENHPYYGTIVVKRYNAGDLSRYSMSLRKMPDKNIAQLTDIARQIAQGFMLLRMVLIFLRRKLR